MVRFFKITLLVMPLFCLKQGYSQRYFNELVDYNTQNYEALSSLIQQKDSSYLAVGFSYDYNVTGSNYYSVHYNKYGQKIHENFLSMPFKESQGMAIKKISDTTFIVCGLINDLAPDNSTRTNRDMFLLKVKKNGDTLWTKRYGLTVGTASSPDYEIANDIVITKDKGFAMVGFSYPTGGNAQIFLVKTDSAGDFLWQQTYGGANTDAAYSIIETPDKGFIMCGYTKSYGAGDRDGYVVKVDSLGNFQWQKTYGGLMSDGTTGICKALEGGYLLSGWTRTNASFSNQAKPWLIKIDANGNPQWSRAYGGNQGFGEIDHLIQLNDSSYICVGGIKDSLIFPISGLLMKVKANGDSLWVRKYKRTVGQDDYFNGFCATIDDGFVLAGQVNQNSTPSATQDGWLIKVDCLGADSITQYLGNGCYAGNISGVMETQNNFDGIYLGDNYPNPFNVNTTIPYALNNTHKKAELLITDVTGKVLQVYPLQNDDTEVVIDVANLPGGFYVYGLYLDKKLVLCKKMVLGQ